VLRLIVFAATVALSLSALAEQAPPRELWGVYCIAYDSENPCDKPGGFDITTLGNRPFYRTGNQYCRIESIRTIRRRTYRVSVTCATTRPGPTEVEIWMVKGRDIWTNQGYRFIRQTPQQRSTGDKGPDNKSVSNDIGSLRRKIEKLEKR